MSARSGIHAQPRMAHLNQNGADADGLLPFTLLRMNCRTGYRESITVTTMFAVRVDCVIIHDHNG